MSAKILLVEDNEQNRYLATFLLEKAGHTVIHAHNGTQALEIAENERLDLVLMDIQMPEMDGYEAARRLRRMSGLENLPVVAVTSYAMVGDREKAMKLGFVGYIEKPISTETFVAEIGQYISHTHP
ncbi:MAG TPA: response regulator [Candidatus Kapabacteria bacterium]|jgi:CheY-like chemotaxis protein|nr:response regulator [Candidatus Kapabacteria bacterium]